MLRLTTMQNRFRELFWKGFKAMIPLWLGIAPFGIAYAVTARSAGLSIGETCLMSLTVFACTAQFAAAGLFASGVGGISIVITTLLLNARYLLYGLSLSHQLPMTRKQGLLGAQMLTDETFGVATTKGIKEPGGLQFAFLLGAELSLYITWNFSTLVGAFAGAVIRPEQLGLAVIFPLAFMGLLIPMLVDKTKIIVAIASGLCAWALTGLVSGSIVILIIGILGALLGAMLTTRQTQQRFQGTVT